MWFGVRVTHLVGSEIVDLSNSLFGLNLLSQILVFTRIPMYFAEIATMLLYFKK
jgi:hypothetical protein